MAGDPAGKQALTEGQEMNQIVVTASRNSLSADFPFGFQEIHLPIDRQSVRYFVQSEDQFQRSANSGNARDSADDGEPIVVTGTRLEPYIVVKGDNLTKLANERGATVEALMDYNEGIIADRNLIYEGEAIYLPRIAGATSAILGDGTTISARTAIVDSDGFELLNQFWVDPNALTQVQLGRQLGQVKVFASAYSTIPIEPQQLNDEVKIRSRTGYRDSQGRPITLPRSATKPGQTRTEAALKGSALIPSGSVDVNIYPIISGRDASGQFSQRVLWDQRIDGATVSDQFNLGGEWTINLRDNNIPQTTWLVATVGHSAPIDQQNGPVLVEVWTKRK